MEPIRKLNLTRYAIALLLVTFIACNGKKANEQAANHPSLAEQADTAQGPRYVKSVQFVYPMKYDTCRYGEETTISFANNRRYPVDSAHVFFNQQLIARLDSTEREFQFTIPETQCGRNNLKLIAFHSGNRQGVAMRSFLVQPGKAPRRLEYELVKTYQHASDASTQGLIFHDGFIYEGTGLYGESTLRKIDLENNKTLSVLSLESQYFGEGITIYKDKIYQLTWTSRKGFVYDITNFALETTFDYNTQGWGLTTMGDTLVMSDGSHKLYLLNPGTFDIIKTIEVFDHKGPVANLNELEYINGEIWANVWLTDRIVVIDPKTGSVTGELLLPGMLSTAEKSKLDSDDDVLNGIAYNEQKGTIYVTGKHWPKLFEIKIK